MRIIVMNLRISMSGRVVVNYRAALGCGINNIVFMDLRISEDFVSGRVVVAKISDEFLDTNAFVTESFESDDRIIPKNLKLSIL